LLAVTQVLGRLRYDLPTLAAIFGEKQGMIESPPIQELLEDRQVIQASPAHRQMLVEDRQQSILRVLRARFQTVPDDLATAVQAVSKAEDLEGYHRLGGVVSVPGSFPKSPVLGQVTTGTGMAGSAASDSATQDGSPACR
jgi:hypothetical protein